MGTDAYPPETVALMSAAFDAAWEMLEEEPTQARQLQLATRIIAAVKAGEREVARLTSLALGEPTGPANNILYRIPVVERDDQT